MQECAGDLSLLQVVRPSRPISWSEGCLDRLKCLSINAILAWSVSWELRKACGGGGGGRPNLAQAGGRYGAALDGALEQARQELKSTLLGG